MDIVYDYFRIFRSAKSNNYSHLIPLHAWHPMQPLTNIFTINCNWVSGDRLG